MRKREGEGESKETAGGWAGLFHLSAAGVFCQNSIHNYHQCPVQSSVCPLPIWSMWFLKSRELSERERGRDISMFYWACNTERSIHHSRLSLKCYFPVFPLKFLKRFLWIHYSYNDLSLLSEILSVPLVFKILLMDGHGWKHLTCPCI